MTARSAFMKTGVHRPPLQAEKPMLTSTRPATRVSQRQPALKKHWPEYLIEAAGLGLFMISACSFGTLLGHPDSPIVRVFQNPIRLRILMGLAMGSTAASIIYSKFGKRSGAHLNPSTTLTFWRLGKIQSEDAFFYIAAQFVGATLGVFIASFVLGRWLAHPAVNYVVTLPGRYGSGWAFFAEMAIAFILISVVLRVTNTPNLNRYTGLFAASLVMIYISVEAPISGMSMNPARTFGSAFSAANWMAIWIYFTAPPLGMLMAAELYVRSRGRASVLCAKLHHDNQERCIFRCNYPNRVN